MQQGYGDGAGLGQGPARGSRLSHWTSGPSTLPVSGEPASRDDAVVPPGWHPHGGSYLGAPGTAPSPKAPGANGVSRYGWGHGPEAEPGLFAPGGSEAPVSEEGDFNSLMLMCR